MTKTDPRIAMRKELSTLPIETVIKRYAKVMGRTPGSVKAMHETGRITRESMENLLVYSKHKTVPD